MSLTADPTDPRLSHGVDSRPTPMAEVYLVLSDEERAKGWVRPLRRSYIHKGAPGPTYPTRPLTAEEQTRFERYGYVLSEPFPDSELPVTGRFWTQALLDAVGKGCQRTTTMGVELCETYARDPSFYGATYCVGCGMHRPVGEFRWTEDGAVVGS